MQELDALRFQALSLQVDQVPLSRCSQKSVPLAHNQLSVRRADQIQTNVTERLDASQTGLCCVKAVFSTGMHDTCLLSFTDGWF